MIRDLIKQRIGIYMNLLSLILTLTLCRNLSRTLTNQGVHIKIKNNTQTKTLKVANYLTIPQMMTLEASSNSNTSQITIKTDIILHLPWSMRIREPIQKVSREDLTTTSSSSSSHLKDYMV